MHILSKLNRIHSESSFYFFCQHIFNINKDKAITITEMTQSELLYGSSVNRRKKPEIELNFPIMGVTGSTKGDKNSCLTSTQSF